MSEPQVNNNNQDDVATVDPIRQVDDVENNDQVTMESNKPSEVAKNKISDIKKAVEQKIEKQKQDNVVKSLIEAFKSEYGTDDSVKSDVENELTNIQKYANTKDKDEIVLSILNQAVEKIEQMKQKKAEIQKEREEIKKISGYSEIEKKISVIKKDNNYNEVWKILDNTSPKLAFNIFKSLTNNFMNLDSGTKFVPSPNEVKAGGHIEKKVASSVDACIKRGDGYF